MTDTSEPKSTVDETPISPIERRNSLEKHLQTRPDVKDLKDRNILLDTNAAPYVFYCSHYHCFSVIYQLLIYLTLSPLIFPTLVNNLRSSLTTLLRALQQAQLELERNQATDAHRKNLEKRPDKQELIERNILPDSNAAPAIQGQQKELEKHMRADSLEQKIQQRPKPEELVKEGILNEDENPLKE